MALAILPGNAPDNEQAPKLAEESEESAQGEAEEATEPKAFPQRGFHHRSAICDLSVPSRARHQEAGETR